MFPHMLGLGRLSHLIPLLTLLGLSTPALAGPHFSQPVPSFEAALATANQGGKVLLAIFSASWCGPCKVLARDMRKPGAKGALEKLHVVIYDGSEGEVGSALFRHLGLSGFPTLVAFDRGGQAAVKQSGYGSWDRMSKWLRELPERAVSIDQAIVAADKSPKHAELQLTVAGRLISLRRADEARRFYQRAQQHGSDAQAATAAWELLRLDTGDAYNESGRQAAEAFIARYPKSSEAGRALRFLAALPHPNVALLERLITARIDAAKGEHEVTGLIEPALHSRALRAAKTAAEWLAKRHPDSPASLDAQAEVAFVVDRDAPRAIALCEKAIEKSLEKNGSGLDERREALARYRRNQGELSDGVRDFSAPRLLPDSPRGSSPPGAYARLRQAQAAVRDGCSAMGGSQSHLQAMIVTQKGAPHQIVFHPNTPAALANCAEPHLKNIDLPPGNTYSVEVGLSLPGDAEAIDLAVATAEEECASLAGEQRSVDLVLRSGLGLPVQIVYAAGTPELRACVDRVLLPLKLGRAVLQELTLRFPKAD